MLYDSRVSFSANFSAACSLGVKLLAIAVLQRLPISLGQPHSLRRSQMMLQAIVALVDGRDANVNHLVDAAIERTAHGSIKSEKGPQALRADAPAASARCRACRAERFRKSRAPRVERHSSRCRAVGPSQSPRAAGPYNNSRPSSVFSCTNQFALLAPDLPARRPPGNAPAAAFAVRLYEMRPVRTTPAHQTANFAELVCSNSLKSDSENTAPWLLKEEMRRAGSLLLEIATQDCGSRRTCPGRRSRKVCRSGDAGNRA